MFLGDNNTTKEIDKYAIEKLEIPSIVLMENAALNFVRNIENNIDDNYLIICGLGNNGGDGYSIAKHLYCLGKKVKIFSIISENMSADCKINYEICKKMNISIETDIKKLEKLIIESNIIIDGIFGTGLSSEIKGIFYDVIKLVNYYSENKNFNKKVFSIDIPSGINSKNGVVEGIAIKADKTITFVTFKEGFLNKNSQKYLGEIIVTNIGIPNNKIEKIVNKFYVDKNIISKNIIGRNKFSHKGDFGKVLLFSGSNGFSGASIIATNSCIRMGAGLVTLLTYDEISKIVANNIIEGMIQEINKNNIENEYNKIEELALKSDVIAIGPGIGNNETSEKIMRKIVSNYKNNENNEIKLIIDADGLNIISKNKKILEKLKNRSVLTPHIMEFSRLTGKTIEEIKKNKIEICEEYAKINSVVLLLKGQNTIITDGIQTYINSTGNSHMANGGMGDCLTGMITSLVAQKYTLLNATIIATYLHGYIGDKLLENQYIINATHIIENIPKYMNEILKK